MSISFNKKNIRLKNIAYMTPLTSPKNIFSDSQRMMLSKPTHMHTHSNISNYIHKGTQIINELYRSTSSSPNTSHNTFGIAKHSKISLTKKTKPLSTQNSNGNIRNTKGYNYHYTFNNVNTNSNKKNENLLKSSSSSSYTKQKIKVNSYLSSVNRLSRTNISNDFLFFFFSPSSTSNSMSNIKIFYNELSKRVNSQNKSKNFNDSSYNNSSSNINYNGVRQLSTKDNSITLNKVKSQTVKNSLTSNDTNNNRDINDIDTPEELHFFYVNILQSGKAIAPKFEMASMN